VNKNTRILITGGQGFIGSHLARYLRDKGFKHIYSASRTTPVEQSNNDSINYYAVDLRKSNEVDRLMQTIEPQVVYHFAADARPSRDIRDLQDMMDSNVNSLTNMLSCIVKNHINIVSFVYAGSCEEYGLHRPPFTENMVTDPISIYSGTKAASSALAKMFYNLFDLPIVTVRPSLVYGPGQSLRFFIPQMIDKVMANETFQMTFGEQTRDFIYIEDVLEGFMKVAGSPALAGEVVNLSYGSSIEIKEIVKIMIEITGSKSVVQFGAIPYRHNEIMSYEVSNDKLTLATGWLPVVSIVEGLSKMISYKRGELI